MTMPMLDEYCRSIIRERPGAAVAWWLMSSFLYYHQDESIISDGMYEELAAFLLEHWETIRHPHRHLIRKEDLTAGSAFHLTVDQYPSIARSAALRLLTEGPSSRRVGAKQEPRPVGLPSGQLSLL